MANTMFHLTAGLLCFSLFQGRAADLDEFKIKRQDVFEFTQKTKLTRQGDQVEIAFASMGYCDATVAVEDVEGRIVRHLASGVLGPNAPAPFLKNSLAQTLVWDGKDDQGRYRDDRERLSVRVSLGLQAQFEKNLFWDPRKRVGPGTHYSTSESSLPTPLIRTAPEGVYVFEGLGVDQLKLFDHQGNYVRTIYPFPANKMEKALGLRWHEAPQDGKRLPLKGGFLLSTFLTSGATNEREHYVRTMFGAAATALAVQGDRIALVMDRVNRLAADGTTGGLSLDGPESSVRISLSGMNRPSAVALAVGPTSAAFSPDGKKLYLTGYMWRDGVPGVDCAKDCLHGVVRIDFEQNAAPALFAGSMKQGDSGMEQGRFRDATSVACDAAGRVYVADYMNDRLQVFAPDGAFLKSIPAAKPARIQIHPRTGEIYVFTWPLLHDSTVAKTYQEKVIPAPPEITRYGPFDAPVKQKAWPLPLKNPYMRWYYSAPRWGGLEHYAELDFWAPEPALWLVTQSGNIGLYRERNGQWELARDFAKEVQAAVVRDQPPIFMRQRLFVDPRNGKLFVAEGQTSYGKGVEDLLAIDPETGKIEIVPMPFDSEDLAFDLDGRAYLRSKHVLVRYDTSTKPWREIPFDYGEERENVGYANDTSRKTNVISGVPLYAGPLWHYGGMAVSPRGHVAVSCYSSKIGKQDIVKRSDEKSTERTPPASFASSVYPGKVLVNEIHVWDSHGKMVYADALPGVFWSNGLGMDKDDGLYVLTRSTRILDGTRYFNNKSGTLLKVKPGKAKVVSPSTIRPVVPLSADKRPGGPPNLYDSVLEESWALGVEWFYGGVGHSGKAILEAGGGCCCWQARFALDLYARSFAPEIDHYSVAVLDSNGNLIMRIGRYGNVDSAGPQSLVPLGADEVGLMHACYVAAHTDRRLFIADGGNARILSVKMSYHAEDRVALKGVPAGEAEK